jgi:tetratricopeptide (TPR) repeat protein
VAKGRESQAGQGTVQVSQTIRDLLVDCRFDEARAVIEAAEDRLAAENHHRLAAWSAMVEHGAGNVAGAIELMRRAISERPDFLSHLCLLSDYLMEAGSWQDAIGIIDRLISLSEEQGEVYFLDDARIKKTLCLRNLGRDREIRLERAKVTANATGIFDGVEYRASDFD